jgi:predicted  nucleic acid-binding Zn-ribbon protein
VNAELHTIIDLQTFDSKIATLEADAARLPKQIEAIQASLAEAKRTVDAFRTKIDQTKKDLRGKEKDLEVHAAKRAKEESRLYEVKTNKEYSAVLLEIEEVKQVKAKTEEEILGLMEMQERLAVDVKEAETRLRTREDQARQDEGVVREKLAVVEKELTTVRAERDTRARGLPKGLLASYERIAKARNGTAVASVSAATGVCSGCRVSIRPQALMEVKHAEGLMTCESCGRYLYWQETP